MTATTPLIANLRERLTAPLPGREAQFKMAFAHRVEELQSRLNPPDNAKTACVMLLLWQELGEVWHTALIRRTENPRDRHSGQISFPGGRHEAGESFAETAIREANEEIGIVPEQVEILGEMTDLYIPVSNFVVRPFIGLLQEPPAFQLQPGEVEQVYAPELAHFQDPASRSTADVLVGGQLMVRQVPCFLLDDRPIWGATAMILSEFLALIPDAEYR